MLSQKRLLLVQSPYMRLTWCLEQRWVILCAKVPWFCATGTKRPTETPSPKNVNSNTPKKISHWMTLKSFSAMRNIFNYSVEEYVLMWPVDLQWESILNYTGQRLTEFVVAPIRDGLPASDKLAWSSSGEGKRFFENRTALALKIVEAQCRRLGGWRLEARAPIKSS